MCDGIRKALEKQLQPNTPRYSYHMPTLEAPELIGIPAS